MKENKQIKKEELKDSTKDNMDKEQPIKEKREITSTTYIRATNRMTRDVNRWFGRGMGK